MKAPLPATEAERLRSLREYDILDTPAEQEFDDLTYLAAQICGTPISLVTLVDEHRQWFKSKIGIDINETPREVSFCSHAILDSELLHVPDATTDQRFSDNPLVISDPHVRFYAGMPLVTPTGHNLGTLCVVDMVPRHLDSFQQDALRKLGHQVVTQLERRQATVTALNAQRFLDLTLDALASNIAVLDENSNIIAVNRAWQRFSEENGGSDFSCGVGANYIKACEQAHGLYADESLAVAQGIRDVMAGRIPSFCLEYPCHSPTEQRWFSVSITRFADASPVRVVAAHENVTARKLSENLLALETSILERVASAEPLPQVLTELALMVEAESPGLLCSVLLLDGGGEHLNNGIGPSLPAEYIQAINGVQIGSSVGSCGTAAYLKQRVIVADIASDPLWRDFRDLALQYGLHACWSEPIFCSQGKILGTFALYYREPRSPEAFHLQLIEAAANLASVAIEGSRSEEQIRFQAHLLDTVGQAAIATDLDGNITYWNRFAETLYGWPAAEVLGQHLASVIAPQVSREYGVEIMEQVSQGANWSGEFVVQRRDGSTFLAFVNSQPVRDSSGDLTGMIGVSLDFTQRKQAEETLRQSEQEQRRLAERLEQEVTAQWQVEQALRASETRFQSIVANTPGMVYQCVARGDIFFEWRFVSEGCRDIFEMEPEEIQANPMRLLEMIHPDDSTSFELSVDQSRQTLTQWKWEGRFTTPSGKTKWIQGIAHPQRQPDRGTLWDGLLLDITARKEAETETERSLSLLQATLEATADGIIAIDTDDNVVSFNRQFVELWNILPELMESREGEKIRRFTLNQLEDVHAFSSRTQELASDPTRESNATLFLKDGRVFERYSKPHLVGERSVGHVSSFRDVTLQKKTEVALQKANDELEVRVMERTSELGKANDALKAENAEHQMTMEVLHQVADALEKAKHEADAANLAKSEFLSRMSHELRTPLNAILGFGQILDAEDLAPREKESVEHILRGGRHLLTLINEILDIARVESGRIELSIEPISLSDVVSESCALVRPLAAQSGIRLNGDGAAETPIHVLADRQRLKQVLINLLSNAIKYNRHGGQVVVTYSHEPNDHIRISVRDTGIGMSAEGLAKLFTPFERLDAAKSEIEGSGLGLVLSLRLVEAMKGSLNVESVVGEGSVFSVEFPQAAAPLDRLDISAETNVGTSRPGNGHTYNVLCIEDNLSNLRLLEVILRSRPEISLLAAMQGSVGLDLARQHNPDLILLDLNLPDISGKEVLDRLRQSPVTQEIPVVIISADATPPQIQRLLAAGAKAYLTKPLNVAEFLNTLDEVLENL